MNAAKTTVIQTDIHRYGLMELLGVLLGAVMSVCYGATQNYGLAIILFTLFTKVILALVAGRAGAGRSGARPGCAARRR